MYLCSLPAAAREASKLLSAAAQLQARAAIPVQEGYYLPSDECREREDPEEEGSKEVLDGSEDDTDLECESLASSSEGSEDKEDGQGMETSTSGDSEGECLRFLCARL